MADGCLHASRLKHRFVPLALLYLLSCLLLRQALAIAHLFKQHRNIPLTSILLAHVPALFHAIVAAWGDPACYDYHVKLPGHL